MDDLQREALRCIRFNWTPTNEDVWQPAPYHVDGLHPKEDAALVDAYHDAELSAGPSPLGVVLQGQRGTGKTHLLGLFRERVQDAGGYFFLVSLLDSAAFWRSGLLSILDGLSRPTRSAPTQLAWALHLLAERVQSPRSVRRVATGDAPLTRAGLDAFVDLLRKTDRQVGLESQDALRALVLLASSDLGAQNIGHSYLSANDEEEPGERLAWGIRRGRRSAQEIVRDLSRLLALTGPTVFAVDQLDVLVAQAALAATGSNDDWHETLLLEQIASGLMSVREMTRRTVTVASCLPHTWDKIRGRATDTMQDRFRPELTLLTLPNADVGRLVVERRLAAPYAEIGFTPPYPSWPVHPDAFVDATKFTPRSLLMAVDNHVRECLSRDEVTVLRRLPDTGLVQAGRGSGSTLAGDVLRRLDGRFADLLATADESAALDPDREDAVVPELLAAGLTAWIAEQDDRDSYSIDPTPASKPALHARLLRAMNPDHDDEAHWSFRAIGAGHAIAASNRIRNAMTASGLTEGVTRRKLFLLRTPAWPNGQRTAEIVAGFEEAGGRTLPFPPADVRVLIALRALFGEEDPDTVRGWCVARRPSQRVGFLQEALASVPAPVPVSTPVGEAPRTITGPSIVVGHAAAGADPVAVGLEDLRRHTAIFAGSGSGKTVLIKRIVEECALQGVSSIVLDPNNDLAHLGDPWPEQPSTWDDNDALRAKEYLAHTDVMVWTPRREGGRPLSFQPLPDFTGVLDDPDEFAIGVDAAVAALAPRAKVDGSANKHQLGQAVLRQALTHFARRGGSSLAEFITLLDDLPDGVSTMHNADRTARDMAQLLAAARINDPLFGGEGTAVDPAVLLTPASGMRARVSVISLIGLPTEEQRQSFVNQLQLSLFGWIKRSPARDRPLGGLLVMDEAQTIAPSVGTTVSTHSTIALASQARKYGLGLVFATQMPKGVHSSVAGNAATQFIGSLNSPVHIAAARDIARAKGADLPDISKLAAGQFYGAVAGGGFHKLVTPMCLSYHGPALTTEEVIERARRGQ